MNNRLIVPCLLACVLTLTSCGGASSWVESSASEPPAQSLPNEPAQSVIAPIVTAPDISAPTTGEPDNSAASSHTGQTPDVTEPPEMVVMPTTPPKTPDLQVVKPKPQQPDISQTEPPAEPDPEPTPEPQPDPEPKPTPVPTKETASAYIGKSVSSMIAAIGEPSGRDYAPSCLGDGEDGELFYDGFTVYTYRVNGKETVQDVV